MKRHFTNIQQVLLITVLEMEPEPLYLPHPLDPSPDVPLPLQGIITREEGSTDGPQDPKVPHWRYRLTDKGWEVARPWMLTEKVVS